MKHIVIVLVMLIVLLPVSACDSALYSQGLPEQAAPSAPELKGIDYLEGATYEQLYTRYGVDVCRAGLVTSSWDNPNEIYPNYLINYFAYKTTLSHLSRDDAPAQVPADLVEQYILRHFDVDVQSLRKSTHYNQPDNTYNMPLTDYKGVSRIVDATLDGNILTLFYECYSLADDTTVDYAGSIVIEEQDAVFFKYLSCSVSTPDQEQLQK